MDMPISPTRTPKTTKPATFIPCHDAEVYFNEAGSSTTGSRSAAESTSKSPDQTDDHWITLESGWGRSSWGHGSGRQRTMVTAPAGPYGVTSGQTVYFTRADGPACSVPVRPLRSASTRRRDRRPGIHYYSPRFNGFQFAYRLPPATGQYRPRASDETRTRTTPWTWPCAMTALGRRGRQRSVGAGSAEAPTMKNHAGTAIEGHEHSATFPTATMSTSTAGSGSAPWASPSAATSPARVRTFRSETPSGSAPPTARVPGCRRRHVLRLGRGHRGGRRARVRRLGHRRVLQRRSGREVNAGFQSGTLDMDNAASRQRVHRGRLGF